MMGNRRPIIANNRKSVPAESQTPFLMVFLSISLKPPKEVYSLFPIFGKKGSLEPTAFESRTRLANHFASGRHPLRKNQIVHFPNIGSNCVAACYFFPNIGKINAKSSNHWKTKCLPDHPASKVWKKKGYRLSLLENGAFVLSRNAFRVKFSLNLKAIGFGP